MLITLHFVALMDIRSGNRPTAAILHCNFSILQLHSPLSCLTDPIKITMSETKQSIDLPHLANLARLMFDHDSSESARADLEKIIAMIDAMQTVDTEGVQPLSHPLDGVQRLRQDIISETEQRENFQSAAPATSDGYYLVPRVVE